MRSVEKTKVMFKKAGKGKVVWCNKVGCAGEYWLMGDLGENETKSKGLLGNRVGECRRVLIKWGSEKDCKGLYSAYYSLLIL